MCYLWQPGILSLNVVSDGLIALAYFSIPFTLLYFVRRRQDLEYGWVFLCFAVFIIACACTHLMEISTIWYPAYWLAGLLKAVTALASVATSFVLFKLLPQALLIPSPSVLIRTNVELQRVIGERSRAQQALVQANETLERRIADRTAELKTLNQSLMLDKARFEIAADTAGLGFWTFDVAGNSLHWDERMFRLYGLAPSSADQPYARWANGLHPDDRARCERELQVALDGGRDFDTDFRVVHPNGSHHVLRAKARIMRDRDGAAVSMIGVNFDITDLKRADDQFRLAIEAAPTGMLLMDSAGLIVLVNAQIDQLFGYPRNELLGQSIEMLLPERFRGNHPDLRASFFRAPSTRVMGGSRELYGLRKDGTELPVEIGLNPLQTSEGVFVLSSIIDLSSRHEIDRMRTDFVSTVSHELRTPLTSISGSLGLLQSGALGALPEAAANMVRIAHENSGRLVKIINDILDIGKHEAGQLDLKIEPTALSELLQRAIEANASYAEKCEVRFRLEAGSADTSVFADPDRLMQVVTNLLSNAAKFSSTGSEVRVRIQSGGTTARVEVEDSGPGIPESFQSRVFEKFSQADSASNRLFQGTGLGLSIARMLMEAMGGSIGFTTVVGRGTIFHIELPRAKTPAAAALIPLLTETSAHKVLRSAAAPALGEPKPLIPKLLYVQDEKDLFSLIRATLSGRAELVAARGLAEVQRLLHEQPFDLVLLDQSLPDGSETSLLARIPALIGHSVPVVLLAAEIPAEFQGKVDVMLIQSQASAAQVAATIFTYLSPSDD
jgi:PAS domain S-box-containing protein